MSKVLKILSIPLDKKVRKITEKHSTIVYIIKDLLKFLKNKRAV